MITILLSILAASGWSLCLIVLAKYKATNKTIKELSLRHTPIKELAANFRDFVESIDGGVSPEVDEALKKLEEGKNIKSHGAPWADFISYNSKVMNPTIENVWEYLKKEIDLEASEKEKKFVVYRWGRKYNFNGSWQQCILQRIKNDADRKELREYFNSEHII